MTLPTYLLNIYDPETGNRLLTLTDHQFSELKWSKHTQDIGALAITIRKNFEAVGLLISYPHLLVDVVRDGVTEGTYITLVTQRAMNDSDEFIVVGGLSPEWLLTRRIVNPDDDTVSPNGGYVTKAGALDTILRELLRENLADLASTSRQVVSLTVPAVSGVGTASGFRLRYEELWEEVKGQLQGSNIDIDVVHTGSGNLEILLEKQGTDKSVGGNPSIGPYTVLSPLRGNLVDPSFSYDYEDDVTYSYVAGPGEGISRSILKLGDNSRIVASAYGYQESYDTVGNLEGSLVSTLTTRARANLQEGLPDFSLDIKIRQKAGFVYRTDWVLGDFITAYWPPIQEDIELVGLEVTVSSGGEEMEIITRVVGLDT
jgi:hypothetical protein